jgi:hypothetical protein
MADSADIRRPPPPRTADKRRPSGPASGLRYVDPPPLNGLSAPSPPDVCDVAALLRFRTAAPGLAGLPGSSKKALVGCFEPAVNGEKTPLSALALPGDLTDPEAGKT